ncbi:hypothetical protein CRI94_05305 [Longibacter salinarum]|uniref:TonB-dependent receptor n=1 Tax=Longibacter salinarum TaxID=1850348 RepID=A0A2A8D0M6_9BACT|nr:TonB-dependent receptor [Longibacter salinarum]PEN14444.1 hypothetical protein CRI94_05305 [Longibacter salinarum]
MSTHTISPTDRSGPSASVRRLISLFLLLAAAISTATSPAYAQSTGTLIATVTDGANESPLPGANVFVEQTRRGTATNLDGIARLTKISTGTQTIITKHIGYSTDRRTVEIVAGDTIRINITLHPSTIGLDGVEVSALSPGLNPSAGIDATRVREIEADDSGQYLRSVPGINVARRGPIGFDPNVRGLTETSVGVYIGGMRTFPAGPLRMDSPLSHVDPSTIASIEVVKGPYALTWGPGNMSAIRAIPRGQSPPPTTLTGTLRTGYDTNTESVETSAFAMGRQGRVFYSANGAWRTGNDYETGAGRTIAADYTSSEARGHIGIHLTPATTLEVRGGYQEQTDIDYPGRLLNADYFKTGMGKVDLSYAPEAVGDGLSLTGIEVQLHAQQTTHGMTNEGKPTYEAGQFPNGNPRPPLRIGVDAEVQNFGARASTSLETNAWSFEVGADLLSTYRDARRPLAAVMPNGMQMTPPFYTSDRVWPGVRMMHEGAFLNVQRSLGVLEIAATGRLDLVQSDPDDPSTVFLNNASTVRGATVTEADLDRSFTMGSGAVTASVPLTNVWSVSAGLGSVARSPQALELYSDRIPASRAQTSAEFQGNPFLEPERSTQADLWIEGYADTWTLRASTFTRRLDNYVTLEATSINPLLPLSPSTVYGYVNGEATFYGAELQGNVRPVEYIELRAAGSYLWGQDETLDEPALGVSPASASAGARWTLPIEGSTVQRFYLDGSVTMTAEQDRVATTRGERVTPGYTVVDLQTGVRLFQRVDLRVTAENVFDVSYTNHLSASNPFSGARIAEPGRVIAFTAAIGF